MYIERFVDKLDDWSLLAAELIQLAGDLRIIAIMGDLGVGKTTLVKHIAEQLAITNEVSSPTFSIVHEYGTYDNSIVLLHLDLYRIKNMDELEQIGIWQYLDRGHWCCIEWPDLLLPYLDRYLAVQITVDQGERRKIVILINGRPEKEAI